MSGRDRKALCHSQQNGLVWNVGRLGNSRLDYNAKYPVVIAKDTHFTKLVIGSRLFAVFSKKPFYVTLFMTKYIQK
ncbi:hypothetical protein L596_000784 [Steinernema carpocapsae]|uniref:Uncharacterized protein n=1 Tax=Steinernema carpocapsae TaxID=34508 RepID=A0A4U8UJ46_STECR|nr:hypothetical protein L596_000784 [Steinernema carpocapsae]